MSARPDPPRIDHQGLRAGLMRAGMGSDFTSLAFTYLGRFSNDAWRIELDNGVVLVAKCAFRSPRPHDHPDIERSFYRFLGSRSDLPVPRFVTEQDGVLILEHLDLEPFSFTEGVSAAHENAALDALATWHAAWWGRAPDLAWLPSYADEAVRLSVQARYDAAWRAHGARLLESVPTFEDLGNALVGRLASTLAPLAEPSTLVHGDAHAENIPLTGSGAVLLDWQDPRIASPGYDLATFTTMSYPAAKRAAVERNVIASHAARLAARGCHWDDPWNGYRLGLLRRVARIVEIADVPFSSLPWVFRRSAVAALDNAAGELIR